MADIGIIGPLKSLKFGGMQLHPKQDSNANIDFGDADYEVNTTGDRVPYLTETPKPGSIEQDIILNVEDLKKLNKLKGKILAGTATTANDDVLTINAAISGELKMADSVTLILMGKIRLQ
jgi:hypothetical protein